MGCGSSLSVAPSINNTKSIKKNNSLNNGNNKTDKLPSLNQHEKANTQRDKNLEPFTLICLDENFADHNKQLRKIIDYLQCFTDVDKCQQYIIDISQTSFIFFIVSSKYFSDIISHIHDLPKVIAIYVFEKQQSTKYRKDNIDKHWAKRYSKMKDIYSDRETLYEQLKSDVEISINIHDIIPITVYSRVDAVQVNMNSTDHICFLFHQLFIHRFCVNSSTKLNKNDFIKTITNYYSSNPYETKSIREIDDEDYSYDNVHSWFMQNSCIQRILTQALLKYDIKILFSLRFFVKDMFKMMIDKQKSSNDRPNSYQHSSSSRFLNTRTLNEQVAFRGLALSKETFLKIKSNIGEILSMNNFLLASKNRQDALMYLRQNVSPSELIYRILFEIKIPAEYSLHKQRPFIDISSINDFDNSNDHKKEIFSTLFFIGSIFRINAVNIDINNECWIIQITLYDENFNEDFSQIFSFLNNTKRTNSENTLILANFLRQISPSSAEQFYQYLLEDNSENLSKIECFRGLGLCSYSEGNDEQALFYFNKALDLHPTDQSIKSSLHNSLGLVYARQNETNEALNHFNKALKYSCTPLHTACVHHNLALIHSKHGHHEDELKHYEEAIKIRTRQLPTTHLQMASLHNNIGIAYSDIHEYDQAFSHLRTSLDIRLKLLSENHIDIARSYANFGTVYGKTQEYRMALDYFTKARALFEKQPDISPDLEQLNKNIKIINDKLRRKTC